MKASKINRAFDKTWRPGAYEMELARAVSHISSTLYEETMRAAVRETVLLFKASHGRDELKLFAHALLDRLEQRGTAAAVKVLDDFIERGRLPDAPPGTPTGPISTRKPVAPKLRSTRSRTAKVREPAESEENMD